MIGELPLNTGGFHETVAEFVPATVVMPVGAPGSEADGVTAADEEAEELPMAFIATTVNVTAVPLVRLSVADKRFLTVTGLPTDGVTVYPVIAKPPFEAGAVHDTVAEALPREAETPVGAPGTVAGVTDAETEEAIEEPTEFLATTVKLRGVPLVRLLSVAVRTLPTVTGLPEDGVTVYPVIAEPPFEVGAVHETVANALPATTKTFLGAVGTVASGVGVTAAEAEEAGESPRKFVATTVNVIDVPLVRLLKLAVRTFPTVTATPVDAVTV